jgi:hypothetical protein
VNPQLLHLILNHLPVVGALWVLVVLAAALLWPRPALIRLALGLSVLLALTAAGAFLTGEPAEEAVEHLPGVDEHAIEAHESSAKASLIGAIASGVAGLLGLLWSRGRPLRRAVVPALLAVLVSGVLLAVTAHRGGQIVRPSLRGDLPGVGAGAGAGAEGEGETEAEVEAGRNH